MHLCWALGATSFFIAACTRNDVSMSLLLLQKFSNKETIPANTLHGGTQSEAEQLQHDRLVECMEQAKNTDDGELGFVMGPTYRIAQCEAGLKPGVPEQGCLPKWPQSWVEQIRMMTTSNTTKVHRYSFVGSVFKNLGSAQHREWVLDFAQKYFTAKDYLRITGPLINATEYYSNYPDQKSRELLQHETLHLADWAEAVKLPQGPYRSYQSLGNFDYSLDGYEATYPFASWGHDKFIPEFESQYWKIMGESCFTLCPDGDNPFSIRFWEAMLAGSIPIVVKDSSAHPESMSRFGGTNIDWNFYMVNYTRQDGRLYEDSNSVVDSFECRQDWIDSNYEKMIKFSTFLEGDNAPPQRI